MKPIGFFFSVQIGAVVFAYIVAESRGRNPVAWAFAALVVGLAALIAVGFLPAIREHNDADIDPLPEIPNAPRDAQPLDPRREQPPN